MSQGQIHSVSELFQLGLQYIPSESNLPTFWALADLAR
jgi:hypothetical protein